MPYDSDIIVIGCGNVLFKDDGYGPIVINLLQKLFNDKNDYYDPAVTDFVENEFDKDILKEIEEKVANKTLPDGVQFVDGGTAAPTNFFPLYSEYDWKKLIVIDVVEFNKCEVVIVGCKPAEIPTPDVDMGLTEPVEKAIPKTIDIILKEIGVK